MADISVTAASVVPTSTTKRQTKNAAAAITAGQVVYVNSSDLVALADNDASVTTAAAVGIALNSCAAGQPCSYATSGDVTFNAVLTAGAVYVLSSTAGGIAPVADLASDDYVTILGVASTTTNLTININASGHQV
jgi:hypothetical protein